MPRRPCALAALVLLAALPAAADEEPSVRIELEFPDEPIVYVHRVEEVLVRDATTRRWTVEARIEYRVVERHPVEGARVEAVLRSARWSGPEGDGSFTEGPAAIARLEVAGGG